MLQFLAANGRGEPGTAIVYEYQVVNVQIRAKQVLVKVAPARD
jgi:hypothetical protein